MTVSEQDLLLQSRAASWNYKRWEWLPMTAAAPKESTGCYIRPLLQASVIGE